MNESEDSLLVSPEQCFIPVDKRGRPKPGCRRHLEDCDHFFPKGDPDGRAFYEARRATDPSFIESVVRRGTLEELRTIPPCSSCGTVPETPTLIRTCPRCQMVLPASGTCDCD